MRRNDREVREPERIKEIIRACDCCRLGFVDGDSAYIVPLNFAFSETNGKRVFYFHGAKEGKKIDLLKVNAHVGFELDTNHAVNRGEKACNYSFRFSSIIGKGTLELVEDVSEKKKALELIMHQYSDREEWAFTDEEANSVAVIKMEVTELCCKEHE